jgi:hypothetical protein
MRPSQTLNAIIDSLRNDSVFIDDADPIARAA